MQSFLNAFGTVMALSAFVVIPWLYLLPTFEAWYRDDPHPDLTSIALVNVLLGWSLVGWVVALIWALRTPEVATAAAEAPPVAPRATKTCPNCAEDVLAAAIKCKHCGSVLVA